MMSISDSGRNRNAAASNATLAMFASLRAFCQNEAATTRLSARRTPTSAAMIVLRDYQNSALAAVSQSWRSGHRAPMLVSPCGSGKGLMLSEVAKRVASRKKRVVVQAHRIELLRQLSSALDRVGCSHGFIAAGYKECISEPVQLASVDTLYRRIEKSHTRYSFDLCVTDEAHHVIRGNKWGRVIDAYPNAKLLGLTASPQRLSGEGLGAHAHGYFDDLILGPTVNELVAQGALVPIKVFAPPLADLSSVKVHHGEYDAAQSAAIMDKAVITGSAISHYKRLCNGKRAIVFAVNVVHSQHIADEFNAAGVPARHVDADTPADEREQAMVDYQSGRLLVLVNVALYTEGIDCPGVIAVIILRKTKSLTMYMQMVGRASRPSVGKEAGILLDHVGVCVEHGLPDFEGIEWSLDGHAKHKANDDGERVQRCRMCQACYAMSPIWRTSCEQCGHVFEPMREPPKQTDGELVEITEEDKEFMRRAQKREVGQAQSRAELEAIAKARGYKSGWVDYIMRARRQNKYHGPVSADISIKQMKGEAA